MGLKIKNVNIMRFHQFLGERVTKNNIYEELPKNGGLAKNRKGVFEGGLIHRCTL